VAKYAFMKTCIGSSSIESLHNKHTSDIVGNVVYDLIQPVVTIYLGAQFVSNKHSRGK